MKPLTVDMLRAHLMVASFTAMATEILACLALLVLPVSQHAFGTMSFRLFAVAVIVIGVVVIRQFAHAAFELAIRSRHAEFVPEHAPVSPRIAITTNCPRRWLVILHLRFTGRPFVLAGH